MQRSQSEFLTRFRLPIYGMRGLRGTFASLDGPLSRLQFMRYVGSRDLTNEFPGVLGIGFVQPVPRRNLDRFLNATRADGAPGFVIHGFNDSSQDDLYVVKYIAPEAQNASALGLDLGSDPTRRRAIEQAVRSGLPTMSAGIQLVQDQEHRPSVLINIPVYANGAALDSPEQRQAALVGIINAPTVIPSLLDARGDIGHGDLRLRLLGPTAPTGSTALWYDNLAGRPSATATTPRYQRQIQITIHGQQLELQLASTRSFERLHMSQTPWWVLMTGLLLSAGAALLLSRHQRTLRQADSEMALAQRSLASYHQLADQTHSAYMTTDLAGRLISVSPGFEQLTDYSPDEALGQHPGSLLQCEQTDPEEVRKIRQALRSNGYYVGEILNRSKQGRLYWVELHIQPHFNPQGEQIGFIGSSIDVTQRRQSRQLLQEAEQNNRNLLEALDYSAIVSFTDLDGMIERVNSGFCRISGYSEAELVGQRHNIVNARADNVVDWRQAWQTLMAGQVWHGEVCNRAKDNQLYWVDMVIVPFFSATGNVNYVSVCFEITQLKQAQAQAEQQTALFQGAITTIGQAFCIYDADDRLVYFNDQYRQLYTKSAEKIRIGETFESIVRFGAEHGQHPDAIGQIDEWVAERLALHRRGDGELVQHLDNGRILRIIERRMPNGYVAGFWIDITDMVKAKETAQAGERAKARFLANMSHEIRTPMNAVLGMLALLRRTAMTTQQNDYVSKAERAGKSLLGLLNDILDLSKIDAGMMKLERQSFQLEQVLRDLAEIFAGTQPSPGVELLLDLDPQATGSVIGDKLRLRQIFINLTSNALKFTHEGHVLISVRVIERQASCLRLLFEVSDTGIGMDAGFRNVIFDAFTQAQHSNTRQYGGTGLGMAITSQFVKLMGGKLQVESEPSQGSRFFFEIDLMLDPAVPARLPYSAGRRWDGLRVLLVDDNEQARELLGRICRSLDWQTTVCDSGSAALALLRTAMQQDQRYDVVFMDCQMPGLSGLQTCTQLREWDPDTPVIMMVTLRCLESAPPPAIDGATLINGQIMKPVTASMLYDAVANLRGHVEQTAQSATWQATYDAPLAGLRLLVAEDNPVNQQLARELLMQEGAVVDIAANGQIAVEMVQAASPPYDMVLMDMQMPLMDGLEATRQIRESLGLLELPIVAMTANAMNEDRQACLHAGMNEHVAKPLDMDELVDMILQHALRRHG